MRNILFLTLFIFPFIQNNAQSWSLVWSDEFNGQSIDSANWTYDIGGSGWGNNELEYYTNLSTNAAIDNDNLLIVAKKESYGGKDYTSARLKSQDLQNWTYGKIEARIKLPEGQGLWPAFWMLGKNISQVSWPKCGEIDIMEHINMEKTVYANMHWDNNGYANYGGNTYCDATQYHVYAVEWNASAIKWFLDGNKYWEGNISNNINGTEEFHLPFFIILNLAVGGSWPGDPDSTTLFPDTMFVDYVRVYQEVLTNIYKTDTQCQINAFPLPAKNKIIIEVPNCGNRNTLFIYNLNSELLLEQQLNNKRTEVDISKLSRGFYFLKVGNENAVEVKKIIIE